MENEGPSKETPAQLFNLTREYSKHLTCITRILCIAEAHILYAVVKRRYKLRSLKFLCIELIYFNVSCIMY